MLEPGQGKDDAQEAKDEAAGDEGDHGRQVHGKAAVKGEGDAEDQEPHHQKDGDGPGQAVHDEPDSDMVRKCTGTTSVKLTKLTSRCCRSGC